MLLQSALLWLAGTHWPWTGTFSSSQVHQNILFLVQRDTATLGHQPSGSPSGGKMTFPRPSRASACANRQNLTELSILSAHWALGFEEQNLDNRLARDLLALPLTSCLPVTLTRSKPHTIMVATRGSRAVWLSHMLVTLLNFAYAVPSTRNIIPPMSTPETNTTSHSIPSSMIRLRIFSLSSIWGLPVLCRTVLRLWWCSDFHTTL